MGTPSDTGNTGHGGGRVSGLTPKEKKMIQGIVAGKSQERAAIDAGYAESTARGKAYAVLQRPLVRSALTEAFERMGVTYEKILKPVADGLNAEKIIAQRKIETLDGSTTETITVPDHAIRLAAHDRAIALYGAVPKVGEGIPTGGGLRVSISVAPQAPARQAMPAQAPNAEEAPSPRLSVQIAAAPESPRSSRSALSTTT